MKSEIKYITAALMAALMLSGCKPAYQQKPLDFAREAITPKSRWKISGNAPKAGRAIDNNLGTAAVDQRPQSGDSLIVDFGRPCMFNMVVVEHGPNPHGYARRLELSTGTDGKRFTTQKTVYGTREVTTVLLIRPTLARYIRLKILQPGPKSWSVGEIYIQ